eukprot:9137484-Alexandrium_andersonii.AAC.1
MPFLDEPLADFTMACPPAGSGLTARASDNTSSSPMLMKLATPRSAEPPPQVSTMPLLLERPADCLGL